MNTASQPLQESLPGTAKAGAKSFTVDVHTMLVAFVSIAVISVSMMLEAEGLMLVLLVMLVFPKSLVSENNKLCILMLVYLGTNSLPLNSVVFLAWPLLVRNSKTFQKNTMNFIFGLLGLFFYSLAMLFLHFEQVKIPVDTLLLRNTLKEILVPIFAIIVYANFSEDIKSLFFAMLRIAIVIVASGVVLMAVGYEGDVRFFESGYPIMYSLPAMFLFGGRVRIVSVVTCLGFAVITMYFGLYISAAFVLQTVVSLAGAYVVKSRKYIAKALALIALIMVLGVDYGEFREMGIPPHLAFKLSQPNAIGHVLLGGGEDILYNVPWTIAARYVELRNVIGDGPLTVLFGKGVYSVVEETVLNYENATGRTFGDSDYTDEEELERQFYTLHNTSRGLLHYGIAYFALSIYLFLKFKKQLDRKDPLFRVKMYMGVLFMMKSLWNPYVSSLYYQFWIMERNKDE